ncbi:hypothetical protein UYSO10_5590 [Kosakonia radicincitans]|nr:hypothetical protein UYSO10_5590 [Kosakonia radicincitans]
MTIVKKMKQLTPLRCIQRRFLCYLNGTSTKAEKINIVMQLIISIVTV